MADVFLDRLREGICEPKEVDVEALRNAAVTASTDLEAPRGLALVRLSYGRPVTLAAETDVRQRLNSKGEVLAADGERQLLAVLAAEALINTFGRTGAMRGFVPGLAVRCARHQRWTPVHPDLESHAEAYMRQRAVAARARNDNMPVLKVNGESADERLNALTDQAKSMWAILDRDRKLVREQQSFAWWLLGKTRPASALAVAVEVWRLLSFVPEPLATDEIVAAKLHGRVDTNATAENVQLNREVVDFCPDFAAGAPLIDLDEASAVRVMFDQLMLSHYAPSTPAQ